MQSNKVEEITDKLEGYLSIDTEQMDKYYRYRQEGKEAAMCGDLPHALELFQLAYQLQPSDKLKKRIQAIQGLIQRDEEEDEEENEFVDVNNSGLKLYKGLYDKLYDHQKEGAAFLYSLHRDGRKGGILADDMGLGKTIQVISFLSGMYDAELANHTLLIMPTSLIKNWVRELNKWTPGMRVKEFHGASKAERNRNLEQIQRRGGVIITTYQMLINNYEQLASYDQHEFEWDYVILDEAHKIKTSSTKTAKSAHTIPARHRVLLTGTPVQNNLQEMWALFEFACQGSLLGTYKTFKTEYENPITRAREKDATPGEKALGLRISQNLMDIIKPYFLRRTKADVQHKKHKREEGFEDEEDQENKCPNAGKGIEMPSLTRKNDLIVWTYLSSVQEDIYEQFISLDHIKELLTTKRSPLSELMVLKKLCDHPRLLSNRAVTQLGLEQGSASIHPDDETESAVSQINNLSDDTLVAESGKLQFLVSLMECLREEGHRTLIFSQSRKMLDIMDRVLCNRNFRLLRLDGTVTQLAEREKRIKLFQTDKRYTIFLLTTQVGGVGITLTAANRVVIFDPSWNPATDAQAVDRAYRIGQTENVIIYRLITCGTVEERIYRRQVFKDSLIRQTTGDKKNPFRYFSKQELHEVFKLEDTRSSTTQQQLQAMHAHHRRSDTSLDQHIARLHTMEMFGISDHDLMFTKEVAAHEDDPEDEESHKYIQTRVQKAQELMQAESELHGQLMDSVSQNTEPAWLMQTGQPKSASRDHPAPPRNKNKPVTVDLTYDCFDEPDLEEEEQNFPTVEAAEVEIVSKEVQIVDEEDQVKNELYDNGASEKQNSVHDLPSPSRHFPKLEELSIASDALDNQEVQVDKPNSTVLSSPQSPHEATAGESFKAEAEMLQGNFNLQLEDSVDMFSVEEEKVCDVEESLAKESPEFQLQMDVSGERLEEASIHESRQYGNQSNGEISKHESLLRIRSAPDTPAEDSFVHSVRRKKRQIISDTDEEEEESEKPCLTSSPLADGLSRLVSSTPKSTLTDGGRLRRSLNTSVASRRSFIVSMLENESDEESEEPSENKTNFYETSEASETHADESVVEEEEPSGGKTKSYETSEASETHADESVVEEEEPSGGKTKSYETSEASETHADESVVEEEEPSGGKTKSYETSQASESHADESAVEEEEPNGDKTESYQISEASESQADESVVEEEEPSGGKTKSYETSEASETHADESVVEEEEPSEGKTKSYETSEASETHADESVVEEEEPSGGKTKFYETSEASETHADESMVEEEEPSGGKTKSYETSQASESHADESAVEEEEPNGDKTESYQISEASESQADESVVEEEEPSGGKTKSYETSEASETHADESVVEEEEPSGGKTKSYETSEASETHADESVVEEEEPSGGKTKSYETSQASESHADESAVEEEEPNGDKTESYQISEASESQADESVVEEEEPSGGKTKSYETSQASESHADESAVEEEEPNGDKTESYQISEASESQADESVVEEEEPSGGKTKSYETSEASETHADESVVEEEEPSGGKTKSYETSEAIETHADESVVEEEEPSGGKTKSYETSEASETHADESVVEEEEPSGGKTKFYETSEASETHADESVVEEEEPSGGKTKSYETSQASENHADESAVEEEEPNGDKTESYQIYEASESQADESVVEEEEPSGETFNSEESESHEGLEEVEESVDSRRYQEEEEWHSALLESTADVELDSNEMMDQCAPKTFPPETHILPVSSTSSDVTAAKPSENTYEMLVLSGKQCLAEGRKQEALDFFLKAIDINTGDAEIQLLIIQLYRQLSQ
ncbi:DNA excision repair protein ERCC-6-like [Sinocyclocheilus rhinocerous]|uniref:DNA excision repair protein ERCC-6-like n=1 Tax=Sinocyclocheilus rhinocerous TaxID=307959 RepID=UPI0007B7A84A|nr:PREDICTED: DNA excision repair protein ERCC-6-like [Sinocyclocheilus rhinocerous]